MKTVLTLFLAGAIGLAAAEMEPLSPTVKSWLVSQSQMRSWSADLTQTRALQSLLEPLTARGRVWFETPGRFRWELGQPPQTIAISTLTNLILLYPRLKRAEVIALAGEQHGPWRSALDMLQAGFPRSEQDLLEHYNVLSQTAAGDTFKLVLQPRSEGVRRMMSRLEIDIDTKESLLRATELVFADGSSMRNDFTNIVKNPALDPALFSSAIPAGYAIVHPQMKP